MGSKRVEPQEVIEMNRLYKECGNYAKVARMVGRSASTVRKYIQLPTSPVPVKSIINNK